MPIIQIAPVERRGMRLLISLFGLSETGKTYSALKLMAGIEPDPQKRGLLDTEGGERGRAYMDAIKGGYLYGALTPPFTPERYAEALADFVAAGVTTLTVDSVSHAWFATGGILDMVENATEKNDMAKWAKPKRRLGKLTNQWLQCGLHLILCSRGKQPMIEDKDANGRKIYVPGPVVPVQEKSLRYDMTIMAQMLGDGRFSVAKPDGGKCPGELRPIFSAHELMDEEMGRKLVAWLGGQDTATPEQRALTLKASEIAAGGSAAFRDWWKEQPQAARDVLRLRLENYQSIAKEADAEAKRVADAEREEASAADHADPFGVDEGTGAAMEIQRPTNTDTATDDGWPGPKADAPAKQQKKGA